MFPLPAGNVGIGTTKPTHRLTVEGTIGARDIIVTNSPWPDYVFRPGYKLRPSREVDEFIRANHHLPDIPSEAEVKQKGVSVRDIQARLLANAAPDPAGTADRGVGEQGGRKCIRGAAMRRMP